VLVDSLVGGVLQPLDLIFTISFRRFNSAICRSPLKVYESFVEFVFENLVFAFQFNEMCLIAIPNLLVV